MTMPWRMPQLKGLPWSCCGGMAVMALALAGCAMGPDYQRSSAPVPSQYKELEGWKPAAPQPIDASQPWWALYEDPLLDQLQRKAVVDNQTLRSWEAAWRQAEAMLRQARAGLWPTLSGSAAVRRSGTMGHGNRLELPAGLDNQLGQSLDTSGFDTSRNRTTYSTSLDAFWDVDLWGRLRRTVESQAANAQASAADLAAAQLSIQTQLASAYFQLRAQDARIAILEQAAAAYERSLRITRNKYVAGIVTSADVALAQTQLESTRAQAVNARISRAQLEHAIAVLTGQPPGDFTLATTALPQEVPVVPVGLPSTLLERRPDIAAAERRMAAANAQIGIAQTAFFPDLVLSGSFGYSSSALDRLFKAASNVWAFGPQLTETLFDAGARSARLAQARAFHEQTIADYRSAVLLAFQQVEDELASLRQLEQQTAIQARALAAAREAERLETNQYLAGTVDYTNVVTAQQNALDNEQAMLTIQEARLVSSVALIQALGGSWQQPAPGAQPYDHALAPESAPGGQLGPAPANAQPMVSRPAVGRDGNG